MYSGQFYEKKNEIVKYFFLRFFLIFSPSFFSFLQKKKNVPADFSTGTCSCSKNFALHAVAGTENFCVGGGVFTR